jgi:ABC-type Na+ efflux pump permease subunit
VTLTHVAVSLLVTLTHLAVSLLVTLTHLAVSLFQYRHNIIGPFKVYGAVLLIAMFMYIYSYLFCLYRCKDYCHRVTPELQYY